MDYFDNISYTQSHLFLMLFLYLFITHRYSKAVTRGICFGAFLILTLTDCLKLNLFPESSLCYIVMTAIQIFVTQFTGIFISGKRNWKVLFMGLSASNHGEHCRHYLVYLYKRSMDFPGRKLYDPCGSFVYFI